ncbi:MAG: N5-glutamine methyltransferase family protein [Candidatus Limnocylindria bacterium]
MPSPESVGSAVTAATDRLRSAGSPSARLDAEVLVAHVIETDRSWVIAHPEWPLTASAGERLGALVDRRAAGEPIAYIRGYKEWRSLRIRTDRRALIPRPETELLATAAIADLERRLARDDAPIVAWEVATGSGAVSIVLARRFRSALSLGRIRLIASDVSPEALELAAENLADHGVQQLVTLACADLLEPAGSTLPMPDLVIANLPYVASSDVEARRDSLGYEPRLALDGGTDGLAVLRRLLTGLAASTVGGATVLLEIGVGQAAEVAGLSPRGAGVAIVPDLAGLDRIVRVDLPD